MLTPERQRYIMQILKEQGTVTVRDLVEQTKSSESTIRRDLSQLEGAGKLSRFHGGAETLGLKAEEKTVEVRSSQYQKEKMAIGRKAAEMVEKGDCIYLDAGTTTRNMIEYLPTEIIVVTNGLTLVDQCLERDIPTYLLGGAIKATTRAIVGKGAVDAIKGYRFDKCFLGMNGVHLHAGLTTPDPEEALIKRCAMELSEDIFVLVDQSKIGKVSFSFVHSLEQLTIITNFTEEHDRIKDYQNKTKIEVVTA